MNTSHMKIILRAALAATSLLVAGLASAATTVNLTAQRATATLPDGRSVPMWQFCAPSANTTAAPPVVPITSDSGGTLSSTGCSGGWAPGPTITVPVGDSLTINLTNALPVPTSIVVLGQLGGGLGTPQKMDSPGHAPQNYTTFVGNALAAIPFTPPVQGQRVKSFGTEVPGNAATPTSLSWNNLKPGTYIYETGTLPSLQAPMGLYGLLIVTAAPVPAITPNAFIAGNAYPSSSAVCTSAPSSGPWPAPCYDSDAALLFSEIDPVQNAQVDAAAQAGTNMAANLRWNDPSCGAACYPAAVNYAPIYFLINGQAFDATNPTPSTTAVGANFSSGNVLLRLANAGLRTHIPAVVGLTMSLVGEDGNLAPGKPKVQSEALLTAGKTYDAILTPPATPTTLTTAGSFTANSFAIFDRQGSLSTANQRDGGMHAYLLVGGALVPAAATALANPDFYAVPIGGSINGKVTSNDYGIGNVVVNGANPTAGTLNLSPDGSFTFTSNGTTSTVDTFQYCGNGQTSAKYCATVTLTIGNGTTSTTANASCPSAITLASARFNSNVASVFKASSPGVLAGACDPGNYALTVASSANSSTNPCGSITVNIDGSFTATKGANASCQFTYTAKDSQGLTSTSATATVNFLAGSGLQLTVVDATTTAAIADYRWVIQEDLTFHHDTSATPTVGTRTLGTSFHRSHNPVVASGCVGPISCGTGQTIRGVAAPLTPTASPSDVKLDPTKRYYISVLPADANPSNAITHIMGGAEIAPGQLAATIALQSGPLVPAQLSVYVYEDNSPTNGQNELTEAPLGGFNVILVDPAGRPGDPAGQQTYDAFNMPMTNALLGSPGCPDDQNAATNGTATGTGNLVGAIYTCPNAPPGYTGDPTAYALAGHALIKNITPARYDVIIHPGAARAGETWWQTETLEGTAAQDAFTGINEPRYFQEFGPPGFHTTVGFVNPAHVAAAALASKSVACPTCTVPTTGATITGKITSQHMSRPSNTTLWDSGAYDLLSSTVCRVALNSQAGDGPAVAAAECDSEGNFTLTNILPGDYEVQIFDKWLDQIIQAHAVTVPLAATTVALGNIPVLSWFTQFDQNIKLDNGSCNGLTGAALITCDNALPGIPNVVQSTRYRNGAMSNQTATDVNGNGILVELFPLFNWYVTEADQTRFKQTRVDIVVDGGGKPDTTGTGAALWSSTYADGTSSIRSEVPGSASYGLQSFISQRNQVNYIKTRYLAGENGGIQGVVVLSTTRPFDDQRMNVQTIWEPLVPRVNVNLYKRTKHADGTVTLELVDHTRTSSFDDWVNTVLGADNNKYILGPDQVLRDPVTGAVAPANAYPAGAQVNMQCPGQLQGTTAPPPWDLTTVDPFTSFTLLGDRNRCYDGWHNWNQVQAAPYDGRYVFPSANCTGCKTNPNAGQPGSPANILPPGDYVVEAETPQGYEIVKEEDKNILVGDAFVAPAVQQFGPLGSIFILPDQATLNNSNPNNPNTGDRGFQSNPTSNLGVLESQAVGAPTFAECVGAVHRVPDYLSIFPQAKQVAPFAGMDRALCDKKLVKLGDQMQAGTNFFLFTPTPVAANATGIILDDTTSEYNAYSPDFGEKASVPFIPVSTKDFAGHEVSRTYSDQWGAYNLMLPSSWLVNPPTPSGYGPNMLVNCINDPGPIPEVVNGAPTGRMITDPAYNPSYSNFCYTNPFMPGQATYLDTPVVPIASFAAGYLPPDCAYPDATPAISRVDTSAGIGPWLPTTGGTVTITALGDQTVPNPLYAGPFALTGPTSQRTITRHYGFGTQGAGSRVTLKGVNLTVTNWTDASITATVPSGAATGQLVVTAANNMNGSPLASPQSSVDAATFTVGGLKGAQAIAGVPTRVSAAAGQTIQAAIDAATPGDLILVDAGLYNELVIMWKPVRLQGVGAASVIINAAKYPTSKLATWRPTINSLFSVDANTGNIFGVPQIDPLPTQEITGGVILLEPSVLGSEEGAGITVLAKNLPATQCAPGTNTTSTFNGHDVSESNFLCADSRIDGISVTGGDAGGGIYVNGWAHNLEISNNRVYGNAGAYNGGVRIGVPALEQASFPSSVATAGGRIAGFGYDKNVNIHNNSITKNGTVEAPAGGGGAGAGLSICSGTDGYSVDGNWVCGNFGASDGGGIGHVGFSQGGSITRNTVLFNQSFQQSGPTHGGGIVVTGEPAIAGTLTLGSGDVVIDANLVRGNFAEGGHGGGIRLQQINGADVATSANWHTITVTNNMVVNNVAGYSGGGISLADALSVNITSNTVASNDSAGIAGSVLSTVGSVALPGPANGTAGIGKPSPAGISSETTSAQLLAAFTGTNAAGQRTANAASQPQTFENNIVWHNRSFFYSGDGRLCSSNDSTNPTCVVLADQASTGECANGAAYWDLGVVGDTSPTAGLVKLNPSYSVLSSGYSGTGLHNSNSNPNLTDLFCNGARTPPELSAAINPPSPKSLQVNATVDEGNNYVNLRHGQRQRCDRQRASQFGQRHLGNLHLHRHVAAQRQGGREPDQHRHSDGAGWRVRPQSGQQHRDGHRQDHASVGGPADHQDR